MRLLLSTSVLLLAVCAHAQQQQADSKADPQVHSDRTVTFRLTAPTAGKVVLSSDALDKPLALHKDASGTWTATTAPLKPEYYSYHFEVDGTETLDPHNVTIKESYLAAGNGFLVPGATPQPWETTAVPHGVVHHHTYTTKVVLGLERDQSEFYVYTPPGYDPRSATKYPVLYLLHGWSDTAAGWTNIGHANDIFDNLIAAGKMKPTIVAMPLGYGEMSFVRSGFNVWDQPATVSSNTGLFAKALLTEILPQIETLYNVSSKREDRAIAGLSMGGLESLTIGLGHVDQFAYVGGFSSALHAGSTLGQGDLASAAQLKLLWIACGTEDHLLEANRKLIATLKAKSVPVTAIETTGGHTWLVWRDNLVNFVPLLFQPK